MHRLLQPHRWRNWSRTVDCVPSHRAYPVTLEEVQAEVLRCSEECERVRIVGRGHAFTPLCYSDENQMSLDHFTGIESVDTERRRVWVRAGTRLYRLGEMLAERGLSLPVFSDSNRQTLGGAVATGCHGSGRDLASIAEMVTGLRMVLPNGSVRSYSSDDDDDLFDAVRISLGVLGVVTHVELQCCEPYRLEIRRRRDTLPRTLNDLDRLRSEHRHLTLFWFPFTDQVHIVTRDATTASPGRLAQSRAMQDFITDNLVGWGLTRLTRRLPQLAERTRLTAPRPRRDRVWVSDAHSAWGHPRWIRYISTEAAIPVESLPQALAQMSQLIRTLKFNVHLPVAVRFAPADQLWLSPAYHRDVAYVAVHMPPEIPYADFFSAMGEVFDRHQGRPHWGALHDKSAHELRALYPRFDDFTALRAECDPHGVLMNRYLAQLLDVVEQ